MRAFLLWGVVSDGLPAERKSETHCDRHQYERKVRQPLAGPGPTGAVRYARVPLFSILLAFLSFRLFPLPGFNVVSDSLADAVRLHPQLLDAPERVSSRHRQHPFTYGAPDSLVTPRKRVAKLATNRLHVRQLGRVAFGPSALAALILVFALGTTARAHAQAPSTITASYDASEYVIAEGASVTVTVALSEGPPQSTEIPLAVQSGGTAATDDYGGVPSSLTFAVGETAKSFTFTATDESDAEQSETVVLGFGTLPDGVTGGGTSTVTIVDDDNGVNILLITADDLNWDSVGVFGSPVEGATPNLDRLAAAGMRFEHAHVMVAVCTPSRSAVMTGRYPNLSGGQGFHDLRMEGSADSARRAALARATRLVSSAG